MFNPSRDQARQFLIDAWAKRRNRLPGTPMDTLAAAPSYGGGAQIATTTTPGTLTYTSTSLLACRGYVYRVRAYTSTTANSLFTNEASATTTCP